MTGGKKFSRNRTERNEWARRLQSEDQVWRWFILMLQESMWGTPRTTSPALLGL
jgi:hypothetical protein